MSPHRVQLIALAASGIGLLLLGCGGDSTPERPRGTLVVSEVVLPRTPVFTEGNQTFVALESADGEEVLEMARQGAGPGETRKLLKRRLEVGRYRLSSWVRPCGGNCSFLEPPRDRCEAELEVRRGESTPALIVRTNEGPCEISKRPLLTPVRRR